MTTAGRKSKLARRRPTLADYARFAAVAAAATIAGLYDTASGQASAFFVREQSAAALGNAFAGATAGADDISYMFFNGAAISRQEGSQIASVGTVVLSRAKFAGGKASTVEGVAIGGDEGGQDGGGSSFIPALYVLWDPSDSFEEFGDLSLGIAVNVPFGFETEYENGLDRPVLRAAFACPVDRLQSGREL